MMSDIAVANIWIGSQVYFLVVWQITVLHISLLTTIKLKTMQVKGLYSSFLKE